MYLTKFLQLKQLVRLSGRRGLKQLLDQLWPSRPSTATSLGRRQVAPATCLKITQLQGPIATRTKRTRAGFRVPILSSGGFKLRLELLIRDQATFFVPESARFARCARCQ